MSRLKCRVSERWTTNSIEILLYVPDFEGNIKDVMTPLNVRNQLITQVYEGMIVSPTLELQRSTIQSLVDELYKEFKILPSELHSLKENNDRELAAVKFHLNDMRSLVFEGRKVI